MQELREQRIILSSVARDLESWWYLDRNTPEEELPVIAVDWSEIFAYATYTPPRREKGSDDEFAAHYAGLCYLFFELPCRLLLLPPYIIEMRNFLQMIETGALLASFEKPRGGVSSAYKKLTQEIEEQKRQDPSFAALLEQDFANVTELSPEIRELLEKIFTQYLPRVYLDLQKYTLDAVRAVRRLTNGTEELPSRVFSLKDLSPELPDACSVAVENWRHWMAEMQSERPRAEVQNRADAVALAYLAALHIILFWKFRRLFFATRSGAMFEVMGRSPGDFPPSIGEYPGDGLYRLSSARPWEYFAEIGYYKASKLDLQKSLEDLEQRVSSVEQLLLRSRTDPETPDPETEELLKDLSRHSEIWETLRGSFDLEGMGAELGWQRLKTQRDRLLIGIVQSLLSADGAEQFFEQRREFAKDILHEIDFLLGQLPDEISPTVAPSRRRHNEVDRFDTWGVLESLNPRRVAAQFLKDDSQAADALLGAIDTPEMKKRATELLRWASGRADSPNADRSTIDWLAGLSLYGQGLYEDASVYFSNWLKVRASGAQPRLVLITRAIAADACIRRRALWQGIELLLNVSEDKQRAFSLTEKLVWHTLLVRFLIYWIAPLGEDADLFPRGADGNLGEIILSRFCGVVQAELKDITQLLDRPVRALVFNALVYGSARYLPETGRVRPERHWFTPWRKTVERAAEHLRSDNGEVESAEYADTLGYFHWKLYLLDRDRERLETAIRFFTEATRMLPETPRPGVERLIKEHLAAARTQVELEN